MSFSPKDFLPQLTRIKNEASWYIGFIAGVAGVVAGILNDVEFSNVENWWSFVLLLTPFFQRFQSFGKESVEEIKDHVRAESSGQTG